MNERDFMQWLDGFLFARESYNDGLDKTDVGYIRYKLEEVRKHNKKETEYDLSEIIRKAST